MFAAGCSTQNTKWANVQYHNTTCHFNVWWNGNESLKEGVKQLQSNHIDNFTQILPVYKLGTKEQAMGVYGQMDKAIEKGVKGISKHSIYQHGKEYVSYVKDCYLLTAYANFYKKDYPATANTCHLIISQFAGTMECDEARILLARTQTMQRQYSDAETALDKMATEVAANNFSTRNIDKLYLAMVECLLPQEKYKKAVQFIRLALDETKDHTTKARLYFIMAQIYQTLDKRPTAAKYYEKVLSCRPDYVMEFNARINIASCSDIDHTNVEERERDLNKMLRDKKNEEFKDQIYYAKGEMYLGMKDAQKACDNFKLSVAEAKNNPQQRAKSALKMADVLYDVYENYDLAQSYYDTAMKVIDIEYPHYDEIRDRYNILTSLVEFTRVIYRNDSLINLANMDPADRETMIKKKIEEKKKKDEEERERQLLEELEREAKAMAKTLDGDWYFYNSNTVNRGKETFRSRWGNRLLEDYWFLSKKGILGMGNLLAMNGSDDETEEDENEVEEGSDSTKIEKYQKSEGDPNDPYDIAYYTKDMPTTQEQFDTMNTQIADCLLNAGYIYYDGIQNTDRALECYLRLANDYPSNDNIVQAFYQLYRIYAKQGNTPSANYYRDMVLMGFPDSDHANLIRDDQYYLEIIHRSQQAQEEYASVYSLYRRRRYADVLKRSQTDMSTYSSDLSAKSRFEYWYALALAQTGDRDSAVNVLKHIIKENVDTAEISLIARNQLSYFLDTTSTHTSQNTKDEEITAADEARAKENRYKQNINNTEEDMELPESSRMFRYKENIQHYVVVIVNDKKIVATQLQYKIADFNTANYSNMGYRSNPLMFTDSTQMLTIHRFKDANAAKEYMTHILLPEGPLAQYNKADYTIFAISVQNYPTFYNRKDTEAYMLFFNKYYR